MAREVVAGAGRKGCAQDLWKLRLERMRGKVDYDGLERVTTQMLFDALEAPQRSRTAGAEAEIVRRQVTVSKALNRHSEETLGFNV